MSTMQLTMTARPRREGTATGDGLRATPGKRRVLTIVLSACVIPTQPQGVHVALQCMREGKPVRRRMPRVVQVERLGEVGVDPAGSFGGHVDELGGRDRPLGTRAIEAD